MSLQRIVAPVFAAVAILGSGANAHAQVILLPIQQAEQTRMAIALDQVATYRIPEALLIAPPGIALTPMPGGSSFALLSGPAFIQVYRNAELTLVRLANGGSVARNELEKATQLLSTVERKVDKLKSGETPIRVALQQPDEIKKPNGTVVPVPPVNVRSTQEANDAASDQIKHPRVILGQRLEFSGWRKRRGKKKLPSEENVQSVKYPSASETGLPPAPIPPEPVD